MFCMFLLPLRETKVTTQGSGSASTCSRPASNDSCDNDQKTNGDRQLPEVQVAEVTKRIANLLFVVRLFTVSIFGLYYSALMILFNLSLRFHVGTFSDFNIFFASEGEGKGRNVNKHPPKFQSYRWIDAVMCQQKPMNFHISQIYTNITKRPQPKKSKRLVELVSYSAKETVEDKE